MRFEPIGVQGALHVAVDRHADGRGYFARIFCEREFREAGLPDRMVQASISFNAREGTLRGLHFQWPPSREGKLVRCTRGAVFDVVLDLRPESPTYLRHAGLVLDESGGDAIFIPHGCAHGFQTLKDDTEVLYQMTDFYAPRLGAGFRWNDPAFGIDWPPGTRVVSDRDAGYPDFDRASYERELAMHRSAEA